MINYEDLVNNQKNINMYNDINKRLLISKNKFLYDKDSEYFFLKKTRVLNHMDLIKSINDSLSSVSFNNKLFIIKPILKDDEFVLNIVESKEGQSRDYYIEEFINNTNNFNDLLTFLPININKDNLIDLVGLESSHYSLVEILKNAIKNYLEKILSEDNENYIFTSNMLQKLNYTITESTDALFQLMVEDFKVKNIERNSYQRGFKYCRENFLFLLNNEYIDNFLNILENNKSFNGFFVNGLAPCFLIEDNYEFFLNNKRLMKYMVENKESIMGNEYFHMLKKEVSDIDYLENYMNEHKEDEMIILPINIDKNLFSTAEVNNKFLKFLIKLVSNDHIVHEYNLVCDIEKDNILIIISKKEMNKYIEITNVFNLYMRKYIDFIKDEYKEKIIKELEDSKNSKGYEIYQTNKERLSEAHTKVAKQILRKKDYEITDIFKQLREFDLRNMVEKKEERVAKVKL